MFKNTLAYLKLHAPPTTLIVAVLAWLFGNKVSGDTLKQVGEIVTLVLGGAAVPPAAKQASAAVKGALAKASK